MSLVQQWSNVIGLCIGFYGVLLLTKEFPFIFGRGFLKVVAKIGKRNVSLAEKLQRKYKTVSDEKLKNRGKWYSKMYDTTIHFLKIRSRTEARHMRRNAEKYNATDINLIDANGILSPDAVRRLNASLHEYVDDLVENGEARDFSVQGLKWVLVSLAFQIFGNLPLPW